MLLESELFLERLEKLFSLIESSNEWKMKYEYFQVVKDINEESIIVSET